MALPDALLADMVLNTLNHMERPTFQQIATTRQEYPFFSNFLKKKRIVLDDGIGHEFPLMYTTPGNAVRSGMFDEDTYNRKDLSVRGVAGWRHVKTHWLWDRRELLKNRGRSQKVDYLQMQELGALIDLADLIETDGWGKPVDSTDTETMWGVAYWIVHSTIADGFTGLNPAGFTNIAGIDSSAAAFAGYRNYSVQHTNMTYDDMITGWRRMHKLINFRSPVDVQDLREGRGQDYQIYTTMLKQEACENMMRQQAEDVTDLAEMDGRSVFKRNPIQWVPALDASPIHPTYFINHNTFRVACLRGDVLHRGDPIMVPNRHNCRAIWLDLTANPYCDNRRMNGVSWSLV